MYSWHYPERVVQLFVSSKGNYFQYLGRYWQTTQFKADEAFAFQPRERFLARGVRVGIAVQSVIGAIVLGLDVSSVIPGGWQFALALLISYPLVWAHLLPLVIGAWWLLRPKALGRAVLCALLEAQVRELRKRHTFIVVAVAGSVGKTSTKLAVASVLGATRRVGFQSGNYNDRVTVPLIFFGHAEPSIFNIPAWLKILLANERAIRGDYPYDYVVVELGTDGPGQMAQFAYIQPDIAVVTAITHEHTEMLGDLDGVAREELTILEYAKQTLINVDDTPAKYLTGQTYHAYGLSKYAQYRAVLRGSHGMSGQDIDFALDGTKFSAAVSLLGAQGAKIALAAATVAQVAGLSADDITKGLHAVRAFSGRMQILPGKKQSTLIDDTYNASPVAVVAALDVLYRANTPQRIALLGNMNELGDYSPEAHREVGEACDPDKLDWVITVGPDANKYLAPVAEAKGCKARTFASPYEAGAFIAEKLHKNAIVLVKGSQNHVFAEEALKKLLADPADAAKLVRQSPYWMAIKQQQFGEH